MILILAIIGAMTGSFVNWCIYNLGDKRLSISPWSGAWTTRSINDRIPVVGWVLLRREENNFGRGFWRRPMLIEAAWTIGLPLFYVWLTNDGLTGGVPSPAGWTTAWLFGYTILIALLFVATFIDFDQRIIPDGVTITGTIIALTMAACWPGFRLPEVIMNMAGQNVVSVDFADAEPLQNWHRGYSGLGIGLAIFAIWILALLPKFPLMAINLKSLQFVFASTIRFLQKNDLKVRKRTRRIGRFYLAIGVIGVIAISLAWKFLPTSWDSLFGALIGMGFGGLMVWSVRIVASHSLGREAMGFGDVTLMAMIGGFLGWQASLLVFALSPFAALAIVLVNFLITKESELAFGPYLCLGTLITILGWSGIWPWAKHRFFLFPKTLMIILAGSLVLLMVMMFAIRILKGPPIAEEEDRNG